MKTGRKFFIALAIAGMSATALAACSSFNTMTSRQVTARLASPAWMTERQIPAGPFALTAFERIHEYSAPATVYIEDDGNSMIDIDMVLNNPTPYNPVALHLATRDRADNLIYLARPCQFSEMLDEESECDPAYWSNARYSPEVVAAYNEALDEISRRYKITDFDLVGFGGGGTIAALVAAQRDDVRSLRTVAGNLNHRAYTDYHNITAFDESANPIDFSARLSHIPQVHYIGGQDQIIPPVILHSYLDALGPTNCVQYKLIQEAAHDEGWVQKWPELLKNKPVCHGPVEASDFELAPYPETEFEPIYVTPEVPEKK